jgi:hypothetical protein
VDVYQCRRCGWWVFQHFDRYYAGGITNYDQSSLTTYQAIVYEFDVSPFVQPVTALRREIVRRQLSFASLSPRDLEVLVTSVFRDYMNCSAKHVGRPGDGGVDGLLIEGEPCAVIQVKWHGDPACTEGVEVVRHLLGTMVLKNVNHGIVVSIASDFSEPARQAALAATRLRGMEVDLYNQHRLRDLLELAESPERPWQDLVARLIRKWGQH